MSQQIVIIRNIEIKAGLKEIGKALGCGPKGVRGLIKDSKALVHDGGPIVPGHDDVYRTEIGELWDWYKAQGLSGWKSEKSDKTLS